jgi:hypothetical protein
MKRPIVCSLALLLFAVPAVAHADSWTQPGYDAAASRQNIQQSSIDASRWRLAWSKSKLLTTNPLILDDRIIVGGWKPSYKVYLWSFDLAGNKLWTRQIGIGYPGSTIRLVDGQVEVDVYNLRTDDLPNATPETEYIDPQTGSRISSIPRPVGSYGGPWWGPPPVVDGQTWVGLSSYCCGRRIPDPVVGEDVALIYEGTSASSTRSYVCSPGIPGGVCAVDIASGAHLWTLATSIAPTIVGDVVFASCSATTNAICRRDLHTGALLSQSPDFSHGSVPQGWLNPPKVSGWDFLGLGAPAVGGGVYFASAFDTTLGKWVTAGFDVNTGDLLTRRRGLDGPTGGWYTAVANGLLVSTVPGLRVVRFDR